IPLERLHRRLLIVGIDGWVEAGPDLHVGADLTAGVAEVVVEERLRSAHSLPGAVTADAVVRVVLEPAFGGLRLEQERDEVDGAAAAVEAVDLVLIALLPGSEAHHAVAADASPVLLQLRQERVLAL